MKPMMMPMLWCFALMTTGLTQSVWALEAMNEQDLRRADFDIQTLIPTPSTCTTVQSTPSTVPCSTLASSDPSNTFAQVDPSARQAISASVDGNLSLEASTNSTTAAALTGSDALSTSMSSRLAAIDPDRMALNSQQIQQGMSRLASTAQRALDLGLFKR
ncbi:MAG: hypothetical protein RLY58_2009 [Pseudomonadota bacterium]|jgi:hypothetical protein